MLVRKQMKKYFTFEVQVLDDKNVRRRFRASNYQSTTRVKPFICTMPMRLDEVSITDCVSPVLASVQQGDAEPVDVICGEDTYDERVNSIL